MKLEEMKLLLRVAQTGSMTLAARQMHLTPAAVSAAIKRVEDALGVRVFERTTRSVHPTEEGLVVLEGCQDVITRWQQTLEGVRGERLELVGSIHVSAPADTTYQVLAPCVAELSDAHPGLQIVVHSIDTVQHLHRDAIDVAIRYGSMKDSTLSARRLASQPGVLVASPLYVAKLGMPLTPDELHHHRLITLQLSSVLLSTWTLHGHGKAHDVELHNPLCGDGYLARLWAVMGKGIALKSLFDVIDDLEEGRLVQVCPGYMAESMAIHMVFPSREYVPARVRAFDARVTAVFEARARRCEAWLHGAHS